jgi:hypothetical protein
MATTASVLDITREPSGATSIFRERVRALVPIARVQGAPRHLSPQIDNSDPISASTADQEKVEIPRPLALGSAAGDFSAPAPTGSQSRRNAALSTIGSVHAIQEWEGYVTAIDDTRFFANLKDLTQGEDVEKDEAEFSLSDFSDGDRSLIQEGAVFRWVVGVQRSSSGTRRYISQVVFRRLPAWRGADLSRAEVAAEKLSNALIWE